MCTGNNCELDVTRGAAVEGNGDAGIAPRLEKSYGKGGGRIIERLVPPFAAATV